MTRTTTELQDEMARALTGHVDDPDKLAAGILASFARITETEIKIEESRNFELITIDRVGFSGVSVKRGNIRLNWRTLFEKIPELLLTGAGVTQAWLIPFAALYLWNLVRALARITLSPNHGLVMYALWNHNADVRRFEETDAHSIVNNFCSTHRMPSLGEVDFGNLLSDLAHLGCIEITDGKIWLREWTQRAN